MGVRFDPPETRYAASGETNIAWQSVGEGPLDLVLVPGWVSHLEYGWEEPGLAGFYQQLASFSRLVLFDKRGTGLSDRGGELPTLEMRMDDVRAVMDAAGIERAALLGVSEGGPMSILFAATHPERCRALALYGTYARRLRAPDYPWGPTPEERQRFYDGLKELWGKPGTLEGIAPSVAGDPRYESWWATYLRRSATPRDAIALARMNAEVDVRPILSAVPCPTLVLHRRDDVDIELGGARYLAENIPGAQLVELEGRDHLPWVGDSEAVCAAVERFLTGSVSSRPSDRMLGTVLVTDLVGSTERAVRLGDAAWQALVASHHDAVRRELHAWRGFELNNTGDGFVAIFDGPARAIRCAHAIRAALAPLALEVRAGLHTGECRRVGNDIAGLTIHIAARVSARAGAGEVYVSSAVKDLVPGAGFAFSSRGTHELKGLPGSWEIWGAEPESTTASPGRG